MYCSQQNTFKLYRELRWGDILLLFALAVLAFYAWSWNVNTESSRLMVEISQEGRYSFYPLDEDRKLVLHNEAGQPVMAVIVEDKKTWVKESDCPLRYCVLRGVIESIGQWVACLPNRVFIRLIAAKEGADTQSPFSLDASVF